MLFVLSLFVYTVFIYYHLLLPAVILLAIVCVTNQTLVKVNLSVVIVLNSFWSYLITATLLYLSTSYTLGWLLLLTAHTPNLNTYIILVSAIFL